MTVRFRSIGKRSDGEFVYVDPACLDEPDIMSKGLTEEGLYYVKSYVDNGVTKYNIEKLLIIEGDEPTKNWLEEYQDENPPTIKITTPFQLVTNNSGSRINNVLNSIDYTLQTEIDYGCVDYVFEIKDNRDADSEYFTFTEPIIKKETGQNLLVQNGGDLFPTRDGIIEFFRDKKNDPTFMLGDIKIKVTYGDKGDDNIEDVTVGPLDGKLEHPITFENIIVPPLVGSDAQEITATATADFGDLTIEQIQVTENETHRPGVDRLYVLSDGSNTIRINKAGIIAANTVSASAHTVYVYFTADSDYTDFTHSNSYTIKLEQPITFSNPVIPDLVTDSPQNISIDASFAHGNYEIRKIQMTDDLANVGTNNAIWGEFSSGSLSDTVTKNEVLALDAVATGTHTVSVRFEAKTDFSFAYMSAPTLMKLEQPFTLSLTLPDYLTSSDQTISATKTASHGTLTTQKLQVSDTNTPSDWQDLTTGSLSYTTATTTNIRGITGIASDANTVYFRAVAQTDFSQEVMSSVGRVNVNYPITFGTYTPPARYLDETNQRATIVVSTDHGQFTTRLYQVGPTRDGNQWASFHNDGGTARNSPYTMSAASMTASRLRQPTFIANDAHTVYLRFGAGTAFADTKYSIHEIKINQPISITTQPSAPASDISSTPQTVSIVASANHGTLSYEWQIRERGGGQTADDFVAFGTNSSSISLTTAIIRAASSVGSSATRVRLRCVVSSDFANDAVNSRGVDLTLT